MSAYATKNIMRKKKQSARRDLGRKAYGNQIVEAVWLIHEKKMVHSVLVLGTENNKIFISVVLAKIE